MKCDTNLKDHETLVFEPVPITIGARNGRRGIRKWRQINALTMCIVKRYTRS